MTKSLKVPAGERLSEDVRRILCRANAEDFEFAEADKVSGGMVLDTEMPDLRVPTLILCENAGSVIITVERRGFEVRYV